MRVYEMTHGDALVILKNKSAGRKDIIKAELEGYFYWNGKPWWENEDKSNSENFDDEVPWYTEPGMPETPQEALEWFKEVFEENKKE